MPHTRINTSYDLGPEGTLLIVTLDADPAAGAEILVTVPGRAVWELHYVFFEFVSDATVSSRRVYLSLTNGELEFSRAATTSDQSASSSRFYPWSKDTTDRTGISNTPNQAPLPVTLLPGWTIRTVTTNLQAGDNFGAPTLYVREIPQRGLAVGQDALLSALRRLIGEEALSG